MVEVWDEYLINARYHLSVARRLYDNFKDYETKRFLSGTINELATACTYLINATLVRYAIVEKKNIPAKAKKRLKLFHKISPPEVSEITLGVIKIKKAQKNSPVEIMKGNEILLLDKGEYKTLTYERLNGLIKELNVVVRNF